MTVKADISIQDGHLLVYGEPLLRNIPSNVHFIGDPNLHGGFLGASFPESNSFHVVPLGVLQNIRFLCCFRFKLWWMTQRMGSCGREVPHETQFMLLEGPSENFTVLLPIIDGAFRACLLGNTENFLQLCVESGDPAVTTNCSLNAIYVNVGTNPFEVISEAVRAVEGHLETFVHRENKQMPGILDYFGWCTWDAFYTDVSAEGVKQGLSSLAGGGTPARFLIIDDGWQSIAEDNRSPEEAAAVTQGPQYASRLTHIRENHKFQKDGVPGLWPEDQSLGLQHTVLDAKTNFNLKYVYVWHALAGYWGGVQPGGLNTKNYNSSLLVQQVHEALEASIARNFPENGCISCMSHSTDNLYYSKRTAVVRASDDFWPRDPASHTIHIASVAYNTLFLSEFMQPDWDMFHSLHPAAEYHAAARAIGGCAVYVSDKPGNHDFDLLKKLVLPDGTVLRALLPGRPTRDCLFSDPSRDGKSLLKIWNMNKCGGVIGIFNCQGAGWCKLDKKYMIHDVDPDPISGSVRSADIERLGDAAPDGWDGDCIVLSHRTCELIRIPRNAALPITLRKLEYELFTVTPVKNVDAQLCFAPLGLIKMFNSGGALRGLEYDTQGRTVTMQVHGCGTLGVYASQRPQSCILDDSIDIAISYDRSSGLISVSLPQSDEGHLWSVRMRF
ncbi:probable galactinol--sucrose galactosyltransferase 2 isoform X2 [Physcomitrium patens]|uniref:galactinol--sucrose galactosyltransferase n=1 Tax=Physcomitrium patens TaxID=3218 RepID=A0A7I4EFK4_PHYPA|nr:probable galactinol--sucrose galactosyltransferase 1 isoform X2 [Physcomitrium patens]|eukprot:XP_024382618.1 probable galactinol--sucrose galactosyltransferase 1 isoform X2 [Physcomitrella patens]